MMYKHQIDECLKRARADLKILDKYHRMEEADHVRRRIESYNRIRRDAPVAKIGANNEGVSISD